MNTKTFISAFRRFGLEIADIIKRLGRNALALLKRLVHAWSSGSEDAVACAILNIMEETMWLFCAVCLLVSFIAGFWKPWCFATCIMFGILTAIVRSNIKDRRRQCR